MDTDEQRARSELLTRVAQLETAEEKARHVKDLLTAADVHSSLIVDAEKLQLQIHFELKRLNKKLAVLEEVAP